MSGATSVGEPGCDVGASTGAVRGGRRSQFLVVLAYAAAMGWLEAVVVVYIRGLVGIAHAETLPAGDEVMRRFHALPWLLPTEQGRELATLVMLVAVGFLAARSWRARFGAFLVSFAVWDIAYYVGLYAMIGWPKSLATMDVLFLMPPSPLWFQPVWVPLAASCVMIAAGTRLFFSSDNRRPG